MESLGKFLIIAGVLLLIFGILVSFGFKGLPGDVYVKKDGFSFYFPVVSSILLSIIISLILYVASRR